MTGNYQIEIVDPTNLTEPEFTNLYHWIGECAYINGTQSSVSVSSSKYGGITTVEVDITNALEGCGLPIFSCAADRGGTRVKFVY